ncbi:unknown [Brachyspira sp. CAG:484]|nr:unknown [Brachyspira sp. CAG:484]
MEDSDTADYSSPNVGIITGDGTPMILSYNTKCEALDPVKSYTWSTEDNKPVSNADYSSPNVGIITGDGTPMILSYNKKCEPLDATVKSLTWSTEDNKPVTNASTSCIAAVFEINGSKKPNKQNEDVALFNANGLGSSCAVELDGGKCFGSAFSPTPLTRAECEAQKDELGIKHCQIDRDYWAGAVQQCGGVKNMPTLNDLAKIASAIYKGNPSVGAKQDVDKLTYVAGTATSLGLPEPSFTLWSGSESSSTDANWRYFDSTRTVYSLGTHGRRFNSDYQAVCLTD